MLLLVVVSGTGQWKSLPSVTAGLTASWGLPALIPWVIQVRCNMGKLGHFDLIPWVIQVPALVPGIRRGVCNRSKLGHITVICNTGKKGHLSLWATQAS